MLTLYFKNTKQFFRYLNNIQNQQFPLNIKLIHKANNSV